MGKKEYRRTRAYHEDLDEERSRSKKYQKKHGRKIKRKHEKRDLKFVDEI